MISIILDNRGSISFRSLAEKIYINHAVWSFIYYFQGKKYVKSLIHKYFTFQTKRITAPNCLHLISDLWLCFFIYLVFLTNIHLESSWKAQNGQSVKCHLFEKFRMPRGVCVSVRTEMEGKDRNTTGGHLHDEGAGGSEELHPPFSCFLS